MNITFVSTFATECGIATYTAALVKAIHDPEITVLAEAGPSPGSSGGPFVAGDTAYFRTWNRAFLATGAFTRSILSAQNKPTVVHFQHEFGIFPNDQVLLDIQSALRDAGIKTVTTLHTIVPLPFKHDFFANLGGTVIVHTAIAATALRAHKCKADIRVIPHGAELRAYTTPRNDKLFVSPGFMSPSKGHKEIIKAVGLAAPHSRRLGLKIVGQCRDVLYLQELEGEIRKYGLESRVQLLPHFVSDEQLIELIQQAGAVILGNANKTSPYSASGQLHQALGCARTVVAKNVPIYNNTPVLLYNDADELANIMLGCEPYCGTELAMIAGARTWEYVAAQHTSLYRDLQSC